MVINHYFIINKEIWAKVVITRPIAAIQTLIDQEKFNLLHHSLMLALQSGKSTGDYRSSNHRRNTMKLSQTRQYLRRVEASRRHLGNRMILKLKTKPTGRHHHFQFRELVLLTVQWQVSAISKLNWRQHLNIVNHTCKHNRLQMGQALPRNFKHR